MIGDRTDTIANPPLPTGVTATVAPMSTELWPSPIAVLDVGGTSIKGGVVRGQVVEHTPPIQTLANSSAETIQGQLAQAANHAIEISGTDTVGLAIGFPGPFDLSAGAALIHGLHKFDAIYGLDLRPGLRSRTAIADLPIRFVRDNEAAGVGEAVEGAGRGVERVLTITLGTGVGACLTDHGIPVADVGDLSVERLARRPTELGKADDVLSARGLAERLGVPTTELQALVESGDVTDTVEDHGHRVGTFLSPVVYELDVDMIVIGGGLAAAFDIFGTALKEALGDTPCSPAALGSDGPLVGAAILAYST
jgi:glucokinase